MKLLVPVTVDGERVDELTLRELTVAELLMLEKAHGTKVTLEQDIHHFAASCGVAPEVIKALGSRDWARLKREYWNTWGNDQPESTSGESSTA